MRARPLVITAIDALALAPEKFRTEAGTYLGLRSIAPPVRSGPVYQATSAAMQQIAEWLEKLGMSEYAQRFAENDIDFTILSDLTDQDLEKKSGMRCRGPSR